MRALTPIERWALRRLGSKLDAEGMVLKAHPRAELLSGSGMTRTGLESADDMMAYTKAYSVSAWIYACTNAIATSGSMLPFKVEVLGKRNGEARWVDAPADHPLVRLLEHPSDEQYQTGMDLMEAHYSDMELTGNHYWLRIRDDDGTTRMLYRLEPELVTPLPDKTQLIGGYKYTVNGRSKTYPRSEVVHFKDFNPLNPYKGLGSLAAARLAATVDVQALIYNRAFFLNDAQPAGTLETDEEVTGDAYDRLVESWEEAHKGASKAHKVALLEAGVKFHPTGINQRDIQFVEGREMTREEIAACFHVPPVLVGIFKYANYANADEQKSSFWHETMMPKVARAANTITVAFRDEYPDGDVRVRFDLGNVHALIREQQEMTRTDVDAIKVGLTYPNECRRKRGLGDDVPWGDDYWAPLSYTSLGNVRTGESEPPALAQPGGARAHRSAQRTSRRPALRISGTRLYDGELGALRFQVREAAREALAAPIESRVRRVVREQLDAERDEMLEKMPDKALSKYSEVDIESWLFEYEYAKNGLITAMRPHVLHAFQVFGEFALTEVGVEVAFDLEDPRVLRAIEEKVMKFAQEYPETTLTELRRTLKEGLAAGENVRELRRRVLDAFNGRKDNVSVVARTEVGGASNRAALEGYVQSGVVPFKEWHSGGPNPRDHHLTAEGFFVESGLSSIVALHEDFIVKGEAMAHPHDPRGSGSNVCNCHCSLLPVVDSGTAQ